VLAVFLVAVGMADGCRRLTDRRLTALVAGPVTVVITAALTGLWHFGDIVLLVVAAVTCVGWVWLGARAERDGSHQGAALTAFGLGVGLLAVLSGWGSPAAGLFARWMDWVGLDNIEPNRVLMIAAVMLLQLVTGNQLVRLILGAVGAVRPAGEPQPSDRLKGGRLLGPMERVLIVGLGLGGQLAAASAVVAAKGIIRFPELSAQRKDSNGSGAAGSGIDEVTEYFLVGSFASWILAMTGLALVL
jgi:hypothetical protein